MPKTQITSKKEQVTRKSMLEFKKVTLDVRPLFEKYIANTDFRGSECAFSNHYVWRDCYNIYWCEYKNFLLLKVKRHGEAFYLQPFGGRDEDLPEVFDLLLEANGGAAFSMHGIYEGSKERLAKVFPNLEFENDRDNWDYIYLREKLETLGGRKLHGQKNHFNAFVKAHPDYSYEPITEANMAECLALGEAWCDERAKTDALDAEEKLAIQQAFKEFKELDLRGGAIRFDGKIQAFSFGKKVNSDTAVLHVEKAVPGVRGLYQAICKEFAAHAWQDVIYLNREEDMGLVGLRKAKEDMHPEIMWKKYNIYYKK